MLTAAQRSNSPGRNKMIKPVVVTHRDPSRLKSRTVARCLAAVSPWHTFAVAIALSCPLGMNQHAYGAVITATGRLVD